jgi:hypothetical protein
MFKLSQANISSLGIYVGLSVFVQYGKDNMEYCVVLLFGINRALKVQIKSCDYTQEIWLNIITI